LMSHSLETSNRCRIQDARCKLKDKFEIRSTKFETNPKFKAQMFQTLVNQFHGESLAVIKYAITSKIFVRSLLLIFAIAVISVFISHRIAGPIYKFERILEALAAGEKVHEITLRKHDEFYRLAQAINKLIRKKGSGDRG